jgi:integrase
MVSIITFKRRWKRADGSITESKAWWTQIRFTKPVRASFTRKLEATGPKKRADQEAATLAKKIETDELPMRSRPLFTVEGMFSKWIQQKGKDLRSGKDIAWQVKLLNELLKPQTLIDEIDDPAVHQFVMAARQAGKSDVVINRCLTRLRATLKYARVKWKAPTQEIDWKEHFQDEPDEKEMYLSPGESRRLVSELPDHIALAFAFSYYTGCRLSEMETLIWERVKLPERIATVETKGKGKEPVYRDLQLGAGAMNVLCAVGVGASGPVFDLTNRRKAWEKARKAIDREDITWHGIRHTAGTELGRGSASDKLVGKALGHSPNSTATRRYRHAMKDEVQDALDSLPDIGLPRGRE